MLNQEIDISLSYLLNLHSLIKGIKLKVVLAQYTKEFKYNLATIKIRQLFEQFEEEIAQEDLESFLLSRREED